ncbi:transmembrane protein 70 homolog, mitochondrial isoform X1 [Folsomia candida]|nr:transmembrane protein 70 homolog, mitochondrial isoform X1 [Folsomia candida]
MAKRLYSLVHCHGVSSRTHPHPQHVWSTWKCYPSRLFSMNHLSLSSAQISQWSRCPTRLRKLSTVAKLKVPASTRFASPENSDMEPEGDTPYVVYDGALKRQLKHIKIFSLATSMGGLPLQPIIFNSSGEHGMAATIAMLSMVGFFTYCTPILIHQLAKKYVTEISYDPRTRLYTAITYSFFLRKKELIFHKEDVVVPDVPGPFTSVLVKTKENPTKLIPLFFAMESFIHPNHYGLIMGYDKPLDLHIRPEDIAAAVDRKAFEKSTSNKKPPNSPPPRPV